MHHLMQMKSKNNDQQSKNMCVKCRADGELPCERKSALQRRISAVHILHPAVHMGLSSGYTVRNVTQDQSVFSGGVFL